MKTLALLFLASISTTLSAQGPPDEGIPFNKVQFFVGTPDQEYRDPYLYFKYTGIPEILVEEIGKSHESRFEYNTEIGCYESRFVHKPFWYYMSYRIRVDFTDEGLYKVWAQYDGSELTNPHHSGFNDGSIMQDIANTWIAHYQAIVDRSMERSLKN